MSDTPRLLYSTVTLSETSWKVSRSPVTISTSAAFGLRLGGERGDDVVGLVAGHGQVPDAERVEDLEDQADLAAELIGGLGPARLVLDVLLVPEGRLAAVEGDRHPGRLLVAQHVDEHRGEAVDGIGRLARRGGEVLHGKREEGPVGERVAVEEQQRVRHLTQSMTDGRARRTLVRRARPRVRFPGTGYPAKAKIVVELKVRFGPRTVDGNAGWFGESGKCWVSKV